MRRIITIVTIILSLILVLSACNRRRPGEVGPPAPLDAVPDIVGTYVVNGFDPLGVEYSGHLTVLSGDDADAYEFQWIVNGSIQEGNGRLEGNILQVEWRHVEEIHEKSQGTATYTVTADGILDGIRFVKDHEGEGMETAYPNQ
ncbi:MAG: hypothetical protein GY803_17630 [Chloroflexi bacterium]|nr:hypothetical protein [Chloroflexota bacterium]